MHFLHQMFQVVQNNVRLRIRRCIGEESKLKGNKSYVTWFVIYHIFHQSRYLITTARVGDITYILLHENVISVGNK